MGIWLNASDTQEATKLARMKQRTNGTLKNGADPSRDFPHRTRLRSQRERISKVSDYAPCKPKDTRAESQPHQKAGKSMGGESASPTNPERAAMANAGQTIQTVRETRRPGRKNSMRAWPRMYLKIGL